MKKSVYIFLLSICMIITVKSQNTIDNPLLFQTWSFKGLGFLSSNFEKSTYLDKNNLGFTLKKNGTVIGNWIENGCYTGEIKPKFKFKRTKGNWKKISDSVIYIKLPMNVSLNGSHVISNLTENQLTLKMFVNLKKK